MNETRVNLHSKEAKMAKALAEATRKAARQVGDVMSNGGTILAIHKVSEDDRTREYVVLALVPGYQPFVTWRYVIGITDLATGGYGPTSPYCWAGDYHRDLGAALDSFNIRTGREDV
jgi:hypothetical protein